MTKKKKIIIGVILIAIAILVIISIFFVKIVCPVKHYNQICPIEIYSPVVNISSNECANQNGRIVNPLNNEDNCSFSEVNIGNVTGMMCPCICCVKK